MRLSVGWAPRALEDLRSIRSWQDAAWIVREVNRYAEDGVGDLRIVVTPQGVRARVLFLPSFRVYVHFDHPARCMWGSDVVRSTRP